MGEAGMFCSKVQCIRPQGIAPERDVCCHVHVAWVSSSDMNNDNVGSRSLTLSLCQHM